MRDDLLIFCEQLKGEIYTVEQVPKMKSSFHLRCVGLLFIISSQLIEG